MRFNTAQLQELSGVRREQLRHWKKVLPPLLGRDGRCEQYTFREVLAVAVISALVDELGIGVKKLADCSGDIFALLHEYEDISSLPDCLHVTSNGRLMTQTEPNAGTYATVPLAELMAKIRARMAPAQRKQLQLPLPS